MNTAERYALYPIEDTEMFDLYHTQGAALWSPSEMDFSEDTHHYEKLPDDLKRVVDLVVFRLSLGGVEHTGDIRMSPILLLGTFDRRDLLVADLYSDHVSTVHHTCPNLRMASFAKEGIE